MNELIEILQYPLTQRAFIASCLVGIMCGTLGCFIVLRHMSLIGDALSHAVLPGVVAGFVIAGYSITGFFTGAVIAGLLTALMITWLQRNIRIKEDAAIGIVFTAMFAAGVIAITHISRKDGVHLDLQDFLFGNILAISTQDLYLTSIITFFVLFSIIVFYRYLFITTFQQVVSQAMGISVKTVHYFLMLLLSISVVASLQSVGVILVVAMLIIPASTAYLITNRLKIMIIWSAFFGLIAAIGGFIIAVLLETSPGPAMTLTGAVIYFLIAMFGPQRGFLVSLLRTFKRKKRIMMEDILKQIAIFREKDIPPTVDNLKNKLGFNNQKINELIGTLKNKKLIEINDNKIALTKVGIESAYQLIRAHRVWESFLVSELGAPENQIHEQAEAYEHDLPEHIIDEADISLGMPEQDPHGSTIPRQKTENIQDLYSISLNTKAIIISRQEDEKSVQKLWELGITPNTPFKVIEKQAENITLLLKDKKLIIDKSIAEKIQIHAYSDK